MYITYHLRWHTSKIEHITGCLAIASPTPMCSFLSGSHRTQLSLCHSQPTPLFCLTLWLCCIFSAQNRDLCFVHIGYFSSRKACCYPRPVECCLLHSSSSHHFTKSPLCFLSLYTKADEAICSLTSMPAFYYYKVLGDQHTTLRHLGLCEVVNINL